MGVSARICSADWRPTSTSCCGLKRLKPGLKRGCERDPGGACIPPCRDPLQFNWPTNNEKTNNDNAILRLIIPGASLKVSKAASLNDLLTGGSQMQVAGQESEGRGDGGTGRRRDGRTERPQRR